MAVTGDDEDNLVICQVAKRRFNVPRVIARINNPKNEGIFRLLGIDATVSSTDLILSVIEQEIPEQALVPLLRLRHADVEVVDITLPKDSTLDGVALRELRLPPESLIAFVIRGGESIFPIGDDDAALRRRDPGPHPAGLRRGPAQAVLRARRRRQRRSPSLSAIRVRRAGHPAEVATFSGPEGIW